VSTIPTFDELEAGWLRGPAPARAVGRVDLLVLRTGDGMHETPGTALLSPELGLHGDRWSAGAAPNLACQVTLMMTRVAALVTAGRHPLHEAGDNLLVNLDLGEDALAVGARVRAGSAVLLVTNEPHTGCRKFRERFGQDALRWVNWKEHRARRLRGVNCRVLEAGRVTIGDAVEVLEAR
jgi:hypothetical protein